MPTAWVQTANHTGRPLRGHFMRQSKPFFVLQMLLGCLAHVRVAIAGTSGDMP